MNDSGTNDSGTTEFDKHLDRVCAVRPCEKARTTLKTMRTLLRNGLESDTSEGDEKYTTVTSSLRSDDL